MPRLKYAFRSIANSPFLSIAVVLSLGLGIGVNTAIFSVMHQIMLSSLDVDRPGELALLYTPGQPKSGSSSSDDSGGRDYIFSYPAFRELERRPEGVVGVAGFRRQETNVGFGNQTISGSVMMVSGRYFDLLRVTPLLGRAITPADDLQGGNAVAVLSYRYWQGRLGGDRGVLNRPLRINGQIFTVVGIAPKGFDGTSLMTEPDAFVPLSAKRLLTTDWKGAERFDDYWIYLFARLEPGVTRQQAALALNSVYHPLVEEQASNLSKSDEAEARRLRASRLDLKDGKYGHNTMREEGATPMFILMAATGMVLLIAMANAANILLARSARRRKEMAIRSALGAGRGDIVGDLLLEAVLLALCGGLAGLLLARVTLDFLLAQLATAGPGTTFLTAQLQWPVLLYALGLALLTGLLFGFYPSWEAARGAPASTLNQESGHASTARGPARVRRTLVCAQVMISAALLIPAGLFLKSLVNLTRVDLGIRTENVITFGISPVHNGYRPEESRLLFERLERDLAAIPGVAGVTSGLVPLIGNSTWNTSIDAGGFTGKDRESMSSFNEIGPGYFGQLGIPLIMGREFTERDNLAAPRVAIVNEQFARHFFKGGSPIGRTFRLGGRNARDIEVVGLVKDSRYSSVKQAPPRLFFTPWRQDETLGAVHLYVRTALPANALISQVRAVVRSADPDLPAEDLRTMDEQITANIRPDFLILQLASAAALLATALAMLGLYGVMANSVARRTREIGIRMAMGAAPGAVSRMVLREVLVVLAVGLGVGVPMALGLARLTESQLFGVQASDPLVVGAAVAALSAAAFAAGYFPARRAARIDPMAALRPE